MRLYKRIYCYSNAGDIDINIRAWNRAHFIDVLTSLCGASGNLWDQNEVGALHLVGYDRAASSALVCAQHIICNPNNAEHDMFRVWFAFFSIKD